MNTGTLALKGFCTLLTGLFLIPTLLYSQEEHASLFLTHGVASGAVTAHNAVIWARVNAPATVSVEYARDPDFAQPQAGPRVVTHQIQDYTARLKLSGLRPDTVYFYRVWASQAETALRSPSVQGRLRTAPLATQRRAVSFVFGGDLGGQQFCRPYAIFEKMRELEPDFFIANGDMIYADNDCPSDIPATPERAGWHNIPGDFPSVTQVDWTNLDQLRTVFWQHWRYNRADAAFQNFLGQVPMYVQWDDHELINDSGAGWSYWRPGPRRGYPNLVQVGRQAMLLYAPIDPHPEEPYRVYRSFRWGKDLEIFLLDARSYRSRNDLPDTPDTHKTLLGGEQLAWLKRGVVESTATWKVVSSDVPLSIPTGSRAAVFGRDGWANGTALDFSSRTGFERELFDLLGHFDRASVRNLAFITTDVHFAVTLEYALDTNGDGRTLRFHEFVTGPLSALSVPALGQHQLDPSLHPRLVYAEGRLKNFGFVQVRHRTDGTVHLRAEVRGEDGLSRPGSRVELVAE